MDVTERQRQIYYFMAQYFYQYGITPGMRETGDAVGLHGPSPVKHQVDQLVEGGLLDRVPGKAHGLSLHGSRQYPVPLVGIIAGGAPLRLPDTNFSITDYELVFVPADLASPGSACFALKVKGNSMIDALVKDGDTVILRRQNTGQW